MKVLIVGCCRSGFELAIPPRGVAAVGSRHPRAAGSAESRTASQARWRVTFSAGWDLAARSGSCPITHGAGPGRKGRTSREKTAT